MSYIKTISENEAAGKLKQTYDQIKKSNKALRNIDIVHSLRPAMLEANDMFFNSLIHSSDNLLPEWLREAIGLYVSYLNGSEYCIEHHYTKMKELLKDNVKSENIRSALAEKETGHAFDVWEQAIMNYAERLVNSPATITEENIEELKLCGLKDEEILEVVQTVSYYCYENRIALGLGVSLEDHIFGKPTKLL